MNFLQLPFSTENVVLSFMYTHIQLQNILFFSGVTSLAGLYCSLSEFMTNIIYHVLSLLSSSSVLLTFQFTVFTFSLLVARSVHDTLYQSKRDLFFIAMFDEADYEKRLKFSGCPEQIFSSVERLKFVVSQVIINNMED